MESFKISNLVTKMLFSPDKTRKLINGGSLFFEKKQVRRGEVYSGPKSMYKKIRA